MFKPEIIREFISQTAIHETAWLEFFRKNEIQPSIVVFEDFINEYEETAKKLLGKLGILHQENLIFGQRRMKKQSDDLTDEWVKKYIGMYKDIEKM